MTTSTAYNTSTGHRLVFRPSQPHWLRVEGPTDTMDLIPDAEIHEACAAAGVVWAGEAIDEATYRVEVRS